ncbi:MAG: agmatine deiminase family protein [Acidobacteriota bacterium]
MPLHRRTLLKQAAASAALLGCSVKGHDEPRPPSITWQTPDEGHPHRRTWMAFGASDPIWDDLLPRVRTDLGRIARILAEHEPVTMLVRPHERALAARACGDAVELVDAKLDDLWIRDTGPVFVRSNTGELGAVDLNFNGWGNKQAHPYDAEVARLVARKAGARRLETTLVGEGGGIEVDGRGTALLTESCVVNDNRNPGLTREDCETLLRQTLGLRKIIWLPGLRGEDITDGHVDFYARFAKPGVVVAHLDPDPRSIDHEVTRRHLEILEASQDADGRPLEVVTLTAPRRHRHLLDHDDACLGYVNYALANGLVLAPEFGDGRADRAARNALRRLFPDREVVQLDIDGIAAGGGGIHCATLHEPLPVTG